MFYGVVRLVFLLTCLGFATGVSAETRALLVGVSDYDNSDGIADLKGPENDVRLMTRVLQGRGITDITVLADGIDGSVRPTKAAIMAALQDQADVAQEGDFVYIHLSGHGTRQKDQNGDETDGLDEVFLPADVTRAPPGNVVIPNALVDDEIGAAVRAIRAKGADVWLVMDSCYSGSGLRAVSPRTASRFVDPAIFGIDATPSTIPEGQIVSSDADDASGDFLAFYAARSTEVALEANMAADGQPEEWYGLFTSKLAARLEGNGAGSFRQLFQAVLSDLNDGSVPGGARLQTPLWEGTLIDAAVFGGQSTVGVRRFAVTGDELAAGSVHNIAEGTLLGLVADAADAPDQIIGYAQTEATSATHSFLRPVASDCIPRSDGPCEALAALAEKARFAQVVARPIDQRLAISWPRELATGQHLAPDSRIFTELKAAVKILNDGPDNGVELSESDFSISAIWDGEGLWLGARAIDGQTPVGLVWYPDRDDLVALLSRIAKAEALADMLGAVAKAGSILSPNPIDVQTVFRPSNIDDLAAMGAQVSPARECGRAQAGVDPDEVGSLPDSAEIKQCDQIKFFAQGKRGGSRDVNRVHIDAQFCISAEYERIEGMQVAQQLGPDMTMCSDCLQGQVSAGEERLFVVVTEGTTNREVLNLVGLLENCGAPGAATRGTDASRAVSFLNDVAKRPDTRGNLGGFGVSNIWVQQFNWRVLPRREAFVKAGRALNEN